MLSIILPSPKPIISSFSSSSSSSLHHHNHLKPIRAMSTPPPPPPPPPPSSTPPNQLYQPFRPPTSTSTTTTTKTKQHQSLSVDAILDILSNRLGLWHEYAPLIPVLSRIHLFPPSAIEESTGISGVEQNRLVVAAQVRDSLLSSSVEPDVLFFFDSSGSPELLYELRLLSAPQRLSAARRIASLNLDPRAAQELARAMKDFPRRRSDDAWSFFSPSPGDCLAFMYYRLSKEHTNPVEQTATLERALDAAETDRAKLRIMQELDKKPGEEDGAEDANGALASVKVPVVRLKTGEVAETSTVVVLPVVREAEADANLAVEEAPGCHTEGEFGVVVADKEWRRWVALPGWAPLVEIGRSGIAVSFNDGRVLPWKANKGYMEEEILVVVDREKKDVVDDEGFYLVVKGEKGGLVVVRGDRLKESGKEKSLGMVVLVVRPPKEEVEDQLKDDDWE